MAVGKETRSLLERVRRPDLSGADQLWDISQQDAAAFLTEYGPELPAREARPAQGFLRCQTSRSRFVRIATFIRYGFYYVGLRLNLSMALHLWKMNADER